MIQSKEPQLNAKGCRKSRGTLFVYGGLPGCPGASYTSIFFFRDRIRRKNR